MVNARRMAIKEVLAGTLKSHLPHPTMRLSRESVLEGAGDWKAKASQGALWARDCFQLVPNATGSRVKLEEETLFALFHMHCGCDVEESKQGRRIHNFHYSAQIQRPESERVRLDRNDLSLVNCCGGICNPYPSHIKHGPLRKASPCCGESGIALANTGSRSIVGKGKR